MVEKAHVLVLRFLPPFLRQEVNDLVGPFQERISVAPDRTRCVRLGDTNRVPRVPQSLSSFNFRYQRSGERKEGIVSSDAKDTIRRILGERRKRGPSMCALRHDYQPIDCRYIELCSATRCYRVG